MRILDSVDKRFTYMKFLSDVVEEERIFEHFEEPEQEVTFEHKEEPMLILSDINNNYSDVSEPTSVSDIQLSYVSHVFYGCINGTDRPDGFKILKYLAIAFCGGEIEFIQKVFDPGTQQ